MSETLSIEPRRRLGRGLSALLGAGTPSPTAIEPTDLAELRNIPVETLSRNPFQPRKEFDPEALKELADSIKEHGILQPLLVRAYEGSYQLIAGERRWQAAKRAGLTNVPCRVVDVVDKTAWEFSLEENLKRRDLGDLEKAQAFRDYITAFQCSIEELAKQLSMNRSTVSNLLRLLELPEIVKNALNSGKISTGHARALLPLSEADQLELCGRIQAEGLSVRNTEAAVKKMTQPAAAVIEVTPIEIQQIDVSPQTGESHGNPMTLVFPAPFGDPGRPVEMLAAQPHEGEHIASTSAEEPTIVSMGEPASQRSSHVDSLEEQLRNLLGLKVEIKLKSKDSGTILIPFNSNDEFEIVLRQLRRHAA